MKKETKKKLTNSVVATALVAGVMTPVGVVLGNNIKDDSIDNINNVQSRAITTTGGVYDNGTYPLPETLRMVTTNTLIAVPNGFVSTYGNANKIICWDSKNPKIARWRFEASFLDNCEIIAIDYTPYNYGTLVFLYTTKPANNKYDVKLATITDINKIDNGVTLSEADLNQHLTIVSNRIKNYNYDERNWGLSPVIEAWNQTTRYFVWFKGVKYNIASLSTYVVDVKNGTVESKGAILNGWASNMLNSDMVIRSANVFRTNPGNMKVVFFFDWNDSGKFRSEIAIANIGDSIGEMSRKQVRYRNDRGYFYNNNKYKFPSMMPNYGNVSSYASNGRAYVQFLQNTFGPAAAVSRRSFLAGAGINLNSTTVESTARRLLFYNTASGTNFDGWKYEAHAGNFDLAPFKKYGYYDSHLVENDHSISSPLTVVGYDAYDSTKKFVQVISNPHDNEWSGYSSLSGNNHRRTYFFDKGSPYIPVSSDSQYANILNSAESNTANGNGEQYARAGVAVMEYNEEKKGLINDWSRNLLVVKSGANSALYINQNDRGASFGNAATYNVYTRPSNSTTIDLSAEVSNMNVFDVDANWIISKYNLEKSNWWDSEFLTTTLAMQGVPDTSIFTVGDFKRKPTNGEVTFGLYGTRVFTSKGIAQYTDSLTKLKQNWWPSHKVATITLTGFIKMPVTEVINPYNLKNTAITLETGDPAVSSMLYPYWIQNDDIIQTAFKHAYWKYICSTNEEENPFIGLREIPTYNEPTWKDDFNRFFRSFDIKGFDGENGTVTLKMTVYDRYAIGFNPDTGEALTSATYDNVVVSGLRKMYATSITGNSEGDVAINPEWANKNFPFTSSDRIENFSDASSANYQGADIITEDEIKQFIWKTFFESAYDNANAENGWETSNQYVKNLPYGATITNQTRNYSKLNDISQLNDWKMNWNTMRFSSFRIKSAIGVLAVDVRLGGWYTYGGGSASSNWSSEYTIPSTGLKGDQSWASSPYARFYVGGFRTDNVITQVNPENLDVITLKNVSDIPVASATNSEYWKQMTTQIVKQGIDNGWIKFPFWINVKEFYDNPLLSTTNGNAYELIYELSGNHTDVAKGEAEFSISFRSYTWLSDDSGFVSNSGTSSYKFYVTLDGFEKVLPLEVDTSKIFTEFSKQSLPANTSIMFAKLDGNTANTHITNWLTSIEEKMAQYVYDLDVQTNGNLATSLTDWKKRLKFKYYVSSYDTSADKTNEYTKTSLMTELGKLLVQKPGQFGTLWNANKPNLSNAYKIWVEVVDEAPSDALNSIQGKPSDTNVAIGLTAQINTSWISIEGNMTEWINAVSKIKGTQVTLDQSGSIVETLTPPTVDTGYGKGLSFTEVIDYLRSFGYTVKYTYYVKGQADAITSEELPSSWKFDDTKPEIKVTISGILVAGEDSINPFNINSDYFGQTSANIDATSSKFETSFSLSLNVKKMLTVDMSSYANMYIDPTWGQKDANLFISSTGSVKNHDVYDAVEAAWLEYDKTIWDRVISSSVEVTDEVIQEYKDNLKIYYKINGSGAEIANASDLLYEIEKVWSSSVNDASKMSNLKFYDETSKKGLKITAYVALKDENNNDFGLSPDSTTSSDVNHGLGTTFDLSKFVQAWTSTKTTSAAGSTADKLEGFTPPTANGITFDQFEQIALDWGVEIQYSNNGTNWVNSKDQIKTVDKNDPAIYMRLKGVQGDRRWSNEFELSTDGTNKTDSSNDDTAWTPSIKLELNIPKYISIDDDALSAFREAIKPLFSGNTKNIAIDNAKMTDAINTLVASVISGTTLKASDVKVEFKVNSDGTTDTGTTFAQYTNNFGQTVVGDSWKNYQNGIVMRVVLKTTDGNENYDKVETTFNGDDKEYALETSESLSIVFSSTAGKNKYDETINPLKFYVDSVESSISQILVEGETIDAISLTYPASFVYDGPAQTVYTDSSKKLKLEFSTTKEVQAGTWAGYNDEEAQWTNVPPRSIPVEKWLYVRVVPNYDDVEYGPVLEQQAVAHQLDVSEIKPVIKADIDSLQGSLLLEGIINIGGSNQNEFDKQAIKAMEAKALETAIENETARANAAIVYNLRTSTNDTNTNWLSLDELLEKLKERSWSNDSLGVISFAHGYSLKASVKSTNPQYNIADSVTGTQDKVREGIILDSSNIKTQIDISDWITNITTRKALVKDRSKLISRAAVSLDGKIIQPASMPGNISDSFLAGRTYDEVFNALSNFGIGFKFTSDKDSNNWVSRIEQLTSFDDSVNKIYMRISDNTSAQIDVIVDGNKIDSADYEIPVQYPKTLSVEKAWLNEFVAANPVSGNTKYITIDATAEQELVQKIVAANPPFGSDPAPTVWVEYSLGDSGWLTREEFVKKLASATTDKSTNKVEYRLAVDPVNEAEPLYVIDQTAQILVEEDLSVNATIKIFVNAGSYETAADGVSVTGSSEVFTYNYGNLPVDRENGSWTGSKGLKVQWTTDQTALYSDPANSDKWSNSPISTIDPVEKYLAIRIIPIHEGYIYGANYSGNGNTPTAKVHIVDTTNIKPIIRANIDVLANSITLEGIINIGGSNQNEFDKQAIKAMETQAIANAVENEGSRANLEVIYNLRTSATDSNNNWLTLDQLLTKLSERQWGDSTTLGIISFAHGYSLKASVRSTNPQYIVVDENTGTNDKVDEGAALNTSSIKTQIDLSEWVKTITSNKALVVEAVRRRSARAMVDLNGKYIQPVTMGGTLGSSFLAGRGYSEVYNALVNVGINFSFSSDGSTWSATRIEQLTKFDDSTNVVYMRIIDNASSQIDAIVDGEVAVTKQIEIPIQYPKTILVEEEWLDAFIAANPVSGNTKYIAVDPTVEQELVQKIVEANPPFPGDPAPTVWVEYSLGDSGWLKRDAFITKLSQSTTDKSTNKVEFRLAVDPVNSKEPLYAISQEVHTLVDENLSASAEIKIYVNEGNYETIADGVSVEGSNEKFAYDYGQLPVESTGAWSGSKGLKVQWTIDSSATYDDPADSSKWQDTPIKEINPIEKYLAIRIIPIHEGYIYGANYGENGNKVTAKIHVVNTSKIKPIIRANIASLTNSITLEGIINIGGSNQNKFDKEAIKTMEASAIETAVTDEQSRAKVEVVYNLRTSIADTNTEWLILDQLLTKLAERNNWANPSTFGIISFAHGYSLKASIRSTDPEYVVADAATGDVEVVKQGATLNTNSIKTRIDISEWIKTITSNKAPIVDASRNARAIVNLNGKVIRPVAMGGNVGESFLSGRSFTEVFNVLKGYGIDFRFSSNKETWTASSIDQLTNFNDSVNAVYMRVIDNASEQIDVVIDGNTSSLPDFEIPVQYPKALVVQQAWIDSFMAANPVSGNTKYINVDATIEEELVQKIVEANPPFGSDPVPTVWVEYRLGDSGWLAREAFISKLAEATTDKVTNQVEFRLAVDPVNAAEPVYSIDQTERVLVSENISASAGIKIFVNQRTYETDADAVSVSGTSKLFSYNYKNLPVDASTGTWTGAKGLKVQWTTDSSATYDEPADSNKWKDTPVEEINPIEKYLAIRIIPIHEGYIYGANYGENGNKVTAKVHVVDTTNIKPIIEANIDSLAQSIIIEGIINIGGTNKNEFNLDALQQAEANAIETAVTDEQSRTKVEVVYNLRTSASDTNTTWMTLSEVLAKLAERQWTNQSTFGIISFAHGYSLKATIRSTDPQYIIADSTTGTTDKANEGVGLNTTSIKTQVDLSKWIKTITSNKAPIVYAVRNARAIINLDGKVIRPVAMDGKVGESFLSGRSYNEIYNILVKFGINFQFSSNKDNWDATRIEQLTNFNDSTNVVYMRIMDNESTQFDIIVDGNVAEFEEYEIPIKYPKSLVVDQEWLDNFVAANPVSGNTKYITVSEEAEATLVQKIVDANPPTLGDPVPTVWVEYKLGDSGWLTRDAFIRKLAESTVDKTTNKVEFKLAVDPINSKEPVYAIDQTEHVLVEENISETAEIKIYVNRDYENEANGVSIKGTNEEFAYSYGNLPVDASGNWNGSKGLKVQWTTDKTAVYEDELTSTKWQDTPISEIDPSKRYLAIRVVPIHEGYIYSANYSENGIKPWATIHLVDTTNIKWMVRVDLNDLQQNLVLGGKSNNLNIDELKASETTILEGINGGDKLEIRYKVTLNNGALLSQNWMTADEMQAALQEYSTSYENLTSGLIKFTSDGIQGASIQATFVSIHDDYIPVDENGADIEKGIDLVTENIITEIDLSKYMEVLKTVTTELGAGSTASNITGITPPTMTGSKGDELFAGFTYGEIKNILNTMGVAIEFQAPGSSTGDQWVSIDRITDLNNLNELFIRFVPKDTNLFDNIEIIGTAGLQDNANPEAIKLKIELPMVINVDVEALGELVFNGDTHNVTNLDELKAKEAEIIKAVKEANKTGNEETDAEIEAAEIGVLYSLNNIKLGEPSDTTDGVWYTLEEIVDVLANSTTNYGTNRVYAKFTIFNNPILGDGVTNKYQLSSEEAKEINPEQLDDDAVFKVYIHNVQETTEAWIFRNLKVTGTVENYVIASHEEWLAALPKGLSVQYNITRSADSTTDNVTPDDNAWFDTFDPAANNLTPEKDLWIRFVVKPGFIFENALADDPKLSAPIKLDTTQIQVNLKLQSIWLEEIVLSGNLKNLEIDESATRAIVDEQGGLPSDLDRNIVKIEYTFDGTSWYGKDEFIAQLVKQDGAIDSTNWIITRENIKARFVLDPRVNAAQNPPFGLEVDGVVIESGNEIASPQVQLITATKNTDVKGYINANKLTPFIASNFEVNGTNTRATLSIKDVATFNKLLNPYAQSGIFQILYSQDENEGFLPDQKVWDPAKGMVERMNIKGEHSDFYFAVALQAADPNYEVYHDDELQEPNGYVLSSPEIGVYISVEIENPLIGKEVKITFLDENNQPIWYQSEGAFNVKIVAKNGSLLTFDEFLTSLPTGTNDGEWTDEEKQALELAYYVADHSLSYDEYVEATDYTKITDYRSAANSTDKYGIWRTLPTDQDPSTLNLGLKVNDYVIVALRVKERYISSETNKQGYVIKDDKHTPTENQRSFGYKVHADRVQVNWSSLKLRNVGKAETEDYGLDGYAMLNAISLTPDDEDNYQGVSLNLKYFNEFHLSNSNRVLESAAGDRLVKRDSTGLTPDGAYVDWSNKPIVDKDGNTVYKYFDADGIPPAPIKFTNETRSIQLAENGFNNYTLVLTNSNLNAEYSLFANQYIEIEFGNKKGLSPENEDIYDYYVDEEVSRGYTINQDGERLIKFPISNDRRIVYEFNSEEFVDYISNEANIESGLVYDNPLNGEATLIHSYAIRRTANGESEKVISSFPEILQQIEDDFHGQVTLKVTYTKASTGESVVMDKTELSTFNNLSNGDIFKVEIVSANDQLIYADQPNPLVFEISGLQVEPFDKHLLQYLRVEQAGEWNGEGQFRIYLDNPNDPSDDNKSISELLNNEGEFVVRVWSSDQQIKHDWTSDLNSINNLENGDKVEWRLLRNGQRPTEEYYNTIAGKHTDSEYNFNLVSYEGNYSISVVDSTIGKWDGQDQYPTNSGFTIANLKVDQDKEFTGIEYDEFVRLIRTMQFEYQGIDGNGNMVSSISASDVKVNVKGGKARADYTLQYLIDKGYIRFYKSTKKGTIPGDLGYNQFNWVQAKDSNGAWIASPGDLWNDQWIKVEYKDDTMSQAWSVSGDIIPNLIVNGLDEAKEGEPMSMLTWVLVGAAGVATLGIFIFIYFFARNRKLK